MQSINKDTSTSTKFYLWNFSDISCKKTESNITNSMKRTNYSNETVWNNTYTFSDNSNHTGCRIINNKDDIVITFAKNWKLRIW